MRKGNRRAAALLVATAAVSGAVWMLMGAAFANHNPCYSGGTDIEPITGGPSVWIKSASQYVAICVDADADFNPVGAGFNVRTNVSNPGGGLFLTGTDVCSSDRVLFFDNTADPLCVSDVHAIGETGARVGGVTTDTPGGGTFGAAIGTGGSTCVKVDGIALPSSSACNTVPVTNVVGVFIAEGDLPRVHQAGCIFDAGEPGCGTGGIPNAHIHFFEDETRPLLLIDGPGTLDVPIGTNTEQCLNAICD